MGFFQDAELTLIGFFQLENLVSSQVGFLFFDLSRSMDQQLPTEVSRLLAGATKIDPRQLIDGVESLVLEKSAPVVLVCENGRQSAKIAKKLGKMEYLNVCVVRKGINGLVSEESLV